MSKTLKTGNRSGNLDIQKSKGGDDRPAFYVVSKDPAKGIRRVPASHVPPLVFEPAKPRDAEWQAHRTKVIDAALADAGYPVALPDVVPDPAPPPIFRRLPIDLVLTGRRCEFEDEEPADMKAKRLARQELQEAERARTGQSWEDWFNALPETGWKPDDTMTKPAKSNVVDINTGTAKAAKRGVDYDADPPREPPKVINKDSDRNHAVDNGNFSGDPVDILDGTFKTPELPRGLLPKVIEDYAFTMADSMGADAGGIALAALAVCAGVTSDDIKLKMKRHSDDWMESARIWVALVGDPASKKSPVFKAVTAPIVKIDAKLLRRYEEDFKEWNDLDDDEKKVNPMPVRVRYRSDNATIESLQNIQRYNSKVLVAVDELSGLFGAMEKYSGSKGAGMDRSLYLAADNGGPSVVDRATPGRSFTIDNWSHCWLGGIQPTVVQKMDSTYDDGMFQRINPVVVPPGRIGKDEPAPPVAEAYDDLIKALTELKPPDPDKWDVKAEFGHLRFDNEAQALRNELEAKHQELMGLQNLSRKLAGAIGKYDGRFGRYCVLFHAIENAHVMHNRLPPVITIDTARRVARFMHEFLLPHAMAFYLGVLGMGERDDELKSLAGYILAHRKEQMTYRDTQRASRNLKRLSEREANELFQQLTTLGWVLPIHDLKGTTIGGNRLLYWLVNPRVHTLFEQRAKREKKTREDTIKLIQSQVVANRKSPTSDGK